jgi:hypothetical protein
MIHCTACDKDWPDAKFNRTSMYCSGCRKMYGTGRKHRLRRYGITLVDYTEMRILQGGVCKICRKSNGDKPLVVDHDHAMERPNGTCPKEAVRGLLCSTCNHGLGNFRDDPQILRHAIAYLTKK